MPFSYPYPMIQYRQDDGTWSQWLPTSFHVDENNHQVTVLEIDGKAFEGETKPTIFRHIDPSDANTPANSFWLILHENQLYKCDYKPAAGEATKAEPLLANNSKGKAIAVDKLLNDIKLDKVNFDEMIQIADKFFQASNVPSADDKPIEDEEVVEEVIEELLSDDMLDAESKDVNKIAEEDDEVRAPDPVKTMNLLQDETPSPSLKIKSPLEVAPGVFIDEPSDDEEENDTALFEAIEQLKKEEYKTEATTQQDTDMEVAIARSLEASSLKDTTAKQVTTPKEGSEEDTELEIAIQRSLKDSAPKGKSAQSEKSSNIEVGSDNKASTDSNKTQEDADLALAIQQSLAGLSSKDTTTQSSTSASTKAGATKQANNAVPKDDDLEIAIQRSLEDQNSNAPQTNRPNIRLAPDTDVTNETLTPNTVTSQNKHAFSMQDIKNTMNSLIQLAMNNLDITIPALAGATFAIAGFSIALAGLSLAAAASVGVGLAVGAVASAVGFFAVKQYPSLTQQEVGIENTTTIDMPIPEY